MKAREKRRRRKARKARQRERWRAAFEHAIDLLPEWSSDLEWQKWLNVRPMTEEELAQHGVRFARAPSGTLWMKPVKL